MTDLISKLADDIITLINASPRSPRKEEIEQVLRDGMAEANVPLLSKPFQKIELANKVRNVLDN